MHLLKIVLSESLIAPVCGRSTRYDSLLRLLICRTLLLLLTEVKTVPKVNWTDLVCTSVSNIVSLLGGTSFEDCLIATTLDVA